jgi:glyoxylase-like metal-dependent hydrolase (beta-lactamase superfamily II)
MTQQLTQLETALPGLYASAPHPLPFAPSLHIRAFVLQREAGNLLVYASPTLEADAAAIDELGGISRQYLSHRHEAMFVSDSLGAPLFVHEDDRDSVAEKLHVRGSFSRRHVLDGDFEAIPIPGHTPGATAYLWDNGDHWLLFTGDTILLNDGNWVAAVLESSDRAAYIESLELIRGLEFDVLVPWAATGGQPYFALTDGDDARHRIDAILERVRSGGGGPSSSGHHTASRRIIDEATSWPGVEAGPGRRGELAIKLGRRELGHLHGDRAAHFGFPKSVGEELRRQGRVGPHPVRPDHPGWAARAIRSEQDIRDVIELLRLNYERASAADGRQDQP